MKISPVATGAPSTINHNEGMSASPTRLERAKSVMEGRVPDPVASDPQVANLERKRAIKMKTNANPLQDSTQEETIDAEIPISDPVEPVEASSEEIKPLSPQFAALAKEKRALQIERANFDKQKAELEAKSKDTTSSTDLIAKLKSNPLSVLQEHGVTYDQLTEALLAGDDTKAQLDRALARLDALEKGGKDQTEAMTQREYQANKQALTHINNEMSKLVSTGDDYELVRSEGAQEKALQKVWDTWQETGIPMSAEEALASVENELMEDALKRAQYKKVQAKLGFGPPQMRAANQARSMKTLTSRDGGVAPMSPRERALAAFAGKLTR